MPTNREKDKEDVPHMYMKYYSDIEKEWNTVIFSNLDGPRDCHTEWSKLNTERKKLYDIIYHLYVNSKKKKKDTNENIHKTEIELPM